MKRLLLASLLFTAPAVAQSCPPDEEAMGLCTPPPPVSGPPAAALQGPAHAADTVWDPARMAEVRERELLKPHGGFSGSMLLVDRLEVQAGDHTAYAWEAQGWIGGDIDRLWMKTEGEGEFGSRLGGAELQALYSHAIGPFFNLQGGARADVGPGPNRAHLALGVQGLAPYWFEVDAAAFLSSKGELTARAEAEYDQRITNRLILQPRLELALSAQNIPELGLGSGLTSASLGLRLRYEFRPEFAPYLGVQHERRFGRTADYARAAGEDAAGWAAVFGVRFWF